MKWFKHMSNMRHDPKVKRLKKSYGSDGYSVYVEIVTAIADNLDPINNILPFLEEDISEIGEEFNIPSHKTIEIVNFCVDQGLLEKSENNYIFCFKLYKFVDEYFTKKQTNTLDVADRNKAVILAYKEGGLPAVLRVLQECIPNLMETIGVIEINGGNKRSNLALLRPNSGVTPSYVRPDKSTLDKIREDKIKGENIKTQKKISPPTSFEAYKPIKNKTLDPLSNQILSTIEKWNSFENLPQCRYTVETLPSIGDVRTKFDVFGKEDIQKAIGNLSMYINYENYKPTSFDRFICNSLDRWVDSCKPWDRYEQFREKSDAEKELAKVVEFIGIVEDSLPKEELQVYLDQKSEIQKRIAEERKETPVS